MSSHRGPHGSCGGHDTSFYPFGSQTQTRSMPIVLFLPPIHSSPDLDEIVRNGSESGALRCIVYGKLTFIRDSCPKLGRGDTLLINVIQ